MHPDIRDTAGLGTLLWLIGYLASMALFFSPLSYSLGWIILAAFTPFTAWVAWWWFRPKGPRPLQYYAEVGAAWALVAVVLDYLFIVLLFRASYYAPDVFLYYALMFLVPVGVGWYLGRGPAPAG